MRTITLELLRHGTAHNQLLSPLTPYLALCENHAAVTLHVPFEHNQFLHRLSALGYKLKDESRLFQLNDTARVLGEVLSKIPGLTAEANKEHNSGKRLTHLRLIISASELALLPFELALSPNGLPGAGQHLLLQPQMPICLTREIRRVPGEQVQWPKKPKILFITAAPDNRTIPLESHLLALRRLLHPWVKYYDESDAQKRRERVEEYLCFLPHASIEAIEDACASGNYTHIHILAHGVEVKENYDTRFCLALHEAREPNTTEYISGTRLATALRATQRPGSKGLSMPSVVTLASCESGNVGSVAGAGASIAHALHEAGIPMVVAGQFPLSFEGSVRLVECLYEGLLWGTDPRPLLYDLRRRLYSQFFKDNHDWASLIAYMSLPADFDTQLQDVQISQANRSVNAALSHADETTRKLFKRKRLTSDEPRHLNDEEKRMLVENARLKIENTKTRLETLFTSIPSKGSLIKGLLASVEKRQAEVLYAAASTGLLDRKTQARYENQYKELLRKARDNYWDSFSLDRSDCWAVVQYLSLTLTMQRSSLFLKSASLRDEAEHLNDRGNERSDRNPDALWSLAHLLSLYDLVSSKPDTRIWAHGNLIELYLLSLAMKPDKDRPIPKEAERRAIQYADALVDIAGRDSFHVYSTRRQILRYIDWFGKISNLGNATRQLARNIVQRFPEEVEENVVLP
ncbi:MAG TPA: CHAT domain-containing protein [Nitrospiraceae bacterium]|nr:CHAT domain-containing protein [Nitrospiraceae bacterium]